MNSSTITNAARRSASAPRALPKWLQRIDQSEKATFIIDAWLALDPQSQNEFLAQLIAATLHGGEGTALELFASTGQLSAAAALDELNAVVVPLDREAWVDALGRFIISEGNRS